jgi:hypothetical protein
VTQQPPPYPQPPYAQPYQPPTGNTGRTIGIVVGVVLLVILLFCSGIVALFVWFAKSVEHGLADYDPKREGGRDNPITVAVGESFAVDGIDYAAGWRLVPAAKDYEGDTIAGLSGRNERDDDTSKAVFLTFAFVTADSTAVGKITCSSNGSISPGNTETFDCHGSDHVPATYDHVEVSASY